MTQRDVAQLDRTGASPERVSTRNATFQQWQSLLANRTKRHRAGEFIVQGVRPISQAVRQGWIIRALLQDGRRSLSSWAAELWTTLPAAKFVVDPGLMAELGEKSEGTPELLAVAAMRPDDFARIPVRDDLFVTVFDRPASPGNVGTLIRSVDAFGGSGLIITGHAADPYDPRCVRASTGSLFSVPVLRAASHREILAWLRELRAGGLPVALLGTDEDGQADLRAIDLRGPTLLVIGNETTGLTAGWRDECDALVRIPMAGTASSLNAATAGSILLFEAMRQRSTGPGPGPGA
jgi:23S rRNA (uridine2479-2'-O)-methyltransferase